MAMTIKAQPLLQITNPDFQAGIEEAQEPDYADWDTYRYGVCRDSKCHAMEVAVERGISEQQIRRCTGFVIGILSRG